MSRSESMKAYWKYVNAIKELQGVETKTARNIVKYSPTYASKRAERSGKDVMRLKDFWSQFGDKTAEEQKAAYDALSADYEFSTPL